MKLVLLGSGGMMPMYHRFLSSMLLRYDGELYLFDCGEGTQIQLRRANMGLGNINKIFITHLHADHITGLPGLLMFLSQTNRQEPLKIYGPEGLCEYIEANQRLLAYYCNYEIEVFHLSPGLVCSGKNFDIYCAELDHRRLALGYAFIEKDRPGKFHLDKARALGIPSGRLYGKLQKGENITLEDGRIITPDMVLGEPRRGRKVAFIQDTRPCESAKKLAYRSDVLVCEGMFANELEEEANKRGHSTVVQTAQLAKEAEVKTLIITHISPRYNNTYLLQKEARAIFPKTYIGKDLMEYELTLYPDEDKEIIEK